jgi:nitroreductase
MSALNQTIVQQLEWRYATKKFDASKKIAPADWATLEKALQLTASSFGLQPYRFVVVSNPELRKALRAAAWNQPQITDASHLVVFAPLKKVTTADVDSFFELTSKVRGVPLDALKDYKGMINGSVAAKGDSIGNWTQHQAYIALGNLLTVAALLNIDACPMEGFDPAAFDKILGLDSTPYGSMAVAAVGYRAADDPVASWKKVREPEEKLFIHKA